MPIIVNYSGPQITQIYQVVPGSLFLSFSEVSKITFFVDAICVICENMRLLVAVIARVRDVHLWQTLALSPAAARRGNAE